ncbi:uncharacterized protein LOC105426377 [Pogonomyrmex barbatus]|uniref:Uncharacterized protein LOC105426377 n=1 Tax=Pogonomyrmex barbatus TaxID=144034 RepID=A0A6I9W2E5_9HYME|nr:uncharacterized protein LOC105426377 [Pogonomyrmex barbatus]
MMTDDISSDDIARMLEKNVRILKAEGHGPDVALEFRDKLELFGKLLSNVTDKLQSLLYLSENYAFVSNDFNQFMNGIADSWCSINKQICEKCSKIQVGSRTLSGIPLSVLLEKIKKERSLTWELLRTHKNEYSREYLAKCHALLNEIDDLIRNLERSDDKLQQYIATLKLNPFLVELESLIDAYAASVEISSTNRSTCSTLNIFSFVTKLLTGELLGDEFVDPNRVLADNAPRKPVFIIKIKRRMDLPSMPVVETMRESRIAL